jgi:hypothetical protein
MVTRLAFVLGIVFTWPLALVAGTWMMLRTAWFALVRVPLAIIRKV